MFRPFLGYIIIAVAVILSVFIIASAARYKFKSGEIITVTGLAEKDFISDQIVWKGSFTRSSYELRTAYNQLKHDEAEIRSYLQQAGIPDSNIVFSSVDMQRNYEGKYDPNGRFMGNEFRGYNLTGTVTVDSRNIPACRPPRHQKSLGRAATWFHANGLSFRVESMRSRSSKFRFTSS